MQRQHTVLQVASRRVLGVLNDHERDIVRRRRINTYMRVLYGELKVGREVVDVQVEVERRKVPLDHASFFSRVSFKLRQTPLVQSARASLPLDEFSSKFKVQNTGNMETPRDDVFCWVIHSFQSHLVADSNPKGFIMHTARSECRFHSNAITACLQEPIVEYRNPVSQLPKSMSKTELMSRT